MTDYIKHDERVSTGDARAERFLWIAASAILASIFLVLLTDLIVRVIQLFHVQAGTYRSSHLIQSVYYLVTWFTISLAACALAVSRRLPLLVLSLICILVLEFGCKKMHNFVTGRPFDPVAPLITNRFIPHPLLQGIPNPGQFGIVTHTRDNLRLTINSDKVANASLISAYGGSTTYDVGATDNATWTSVLSALLGPNYMVENHGMVGYSTVENLIQTLFAFRSKRPKCALYYLGFNDLRSSNLTDLRADYSNFHLLMQRSNLGMTTGPSLLARRSAFFSILSNSSNKLPQAIGAVKHHYDYRLSEIFKDNVRLIAVVASHFGVKAIFIPQILNYDRLTDLRPYGWLPFVIDADVKELMTAMNGDLADVARETESPFLAEVLQVAWKDADFVDNAHFSPEGDRKFARAIIDRIATECR